MIVRRAFVVFVFATMSLTWAKHVPYKRQYSNDIPPLQIVGIAMAENLENANAALIERGKKEEGLSLNFPILVDMPSSIEGGIMSTGNSQSESQSTPAVLYAWDTKEGGNLKFHSNIAKLFRVHNEEAVTVLILDRKGRVRAIANSKETIQRIYDNKYTELIELLLLNLNGVEATPYDAANVGPEALREAISSGADQFHLWEYAAEIQSREMRQYGDIFAPGFDVSKLSKVYPLLGQQAPDFELPLLDGTGTAKLANLTDDKVTVLVIFWAGGSGADVTSLSQTAHSLEMLKAIERLYVDWSLKLAQPGFSEYAGAQPFVGTQTAIADAYAADAREARTPIKRQVAEPVEMEEDPGPAYPLSVSLAGGARQYFNDKSADFADYEITRTYVAFGAKLNYQVKMLSLEASIMPTMDMGNWAHNDEDTKRQIFFPISLGVKIQPWLFDGKFVPFAGFATGPVIVNTKKRIANRPPYSGMTAATADYKVQHFPSGVTLHAAFMAGVETTIKERIVVGLDIRAYMAKIDPPGFFDDEAEANDGSTRKMDDGSYQTDILIKKPWSYRNVTPFLYAGYKF